MAVHKVILEEVFEEPFELIAIHCSVEDYKMAYLLNKMVFMKFERCSKDLDFTRNNEQVFFTIYNFEDVQNHTNYYLIANKSHQVEQVHTAYKNDHTSLLFDNSETHYLLPELKKIDYFIKVERESGVFPSRDLVSEINEIKQVFTTYSVEVDSIKSKSNLIFDL